MKPKMAICSTHSALLLLLFALFFFFSLEVPAGSALSFKFPSFSNEITNISYERAFPQDQVILLAARNGVYGRMFGRATYYKPMLLWDKATGNLTDFTTHFSFVIDSEQRPRYGDGLAFFLAPQGSRLPMKATRGGSLGLANDDEILNSTSNPFVAVEFDIYSDDYDPPVDHVGVNINSMRSLNNVTWWSDIRNGRLNEAWISYNSSTQILSVDFTGFRDNNIEKQHLDYKVDLRLYLPEIVTFGFSAATGDATARHTINSWEFSSSLQVENVVLNRRKTKKGLALGLGIGGGILVAAGFTLAWLAGVCRKRNGDNEQGDDELVEWTGPKKFSYKELARATNNFRNEQKLGQGGFGGVYKGLLRDTNSYVAVKRVSEGSKQGIKEYATEVKIISRLRHRNLVQLLGWCHENNKLLLVYEYMPNGSLDSHLFKENSSLTWEVRYKIAQDLALALLYLHEEWEQCVLHRDIKSSNIMLDSNFNAKLGDFGLARLVDHEKSSQVTGFAGTVGYMAPECLTTRSKASKESDVFSFGVVALEIACGRRSVEHKYEEDQVSLVPWVWELYGNKRLLDVADKKLSMNFDIKQMECLMIVGLWCAHPARNQRPSIKQALQVLNFKLPLPNLPPKIPTPKYGTPTTPINSCSESSMSSSLSLTLNR